MFKGSRSVLKKLRPHISYVRFPLPARQWNPWYPTTLNEKLNPALPSDVHVERLPKRYNTMYIKGETGRLEILSWEMTLLFRKERVEMPYRKAEELRPYAERLIVEAMRYGDNHRPTMELADFWLKEKQLVHKLFKVMVPRYVNYSEAFTSLWKLPPPYEKAATPGGAQMRVLGVLELKGNPLPPINRPQINNKRLLTNLLLDAARFERIKEEKVTDSK